MTPMQQAANDMRIAQIKLMNLAAMARANLHAEFAPWSAAIHEEWARAVRTQQRECRQCGMTLVALYPAANDEAGQGPAQA